MMTEVTSKYATGVLEMDADHFSLLIMATNIAAMITACVPQNLIQIELADFCGELCRHFIVEETLMERMGCPGLDLHRARHKELAQAMHMLATSPAKSNEKTILSLEEILHDHIVSFDMAAAAHIKTVRLPKT
jgi:hemerythrin-like metal-binding protein